MWKRPATAGLFSLGSFKRRSNPLKVCPRAAEAGRTPSATEAVIPGLGRTQLKYPPTNPARFTHLPLGSKVGPCLAFRRRYAFDLPHVRSRKELEALIKTSGERRAA